MNGKLQKLCRHGCVQKVWFSGYCVGLFIGFCAAWVGCASPDGRAVTGSAVLHPYGTLALLIPNASKTTVRSSRRLLRAPLVPGSQSRATSDWLGVGAFGALLPAASMTGYGRWGIPNLTRCACADRVIPSPPSIMEFSPKGIAVRRL